jgi:predicted permease
MNWPRLPRRFRREHDLREHDLEDEIQSHLRLAAEDRVRGGESREQAVFAARREFGNATLVRESARDVWGWPALETLLQDVRYAIRTLYRTPAFTATAIATLALGIGANTAIFSLVDSLLLKPFAAPDPDRVVIFTNGAGDEIDVASPPKFNVWRGQTALFDDVCAWQNGGVVNLTGVAAPEQVQVMRVSAAFFRLFGVPFAAGRPFTADEDRPSGGHVVVLGNAFWKTHFGADPRMAGKTIFLDEVPYRVAGILGERYLSQSSPIPDVYFPFQLDVASTDLGDTLHVSARLKPGVTLAIAAASLKPLGEDFRRRFPEGLEANESFGVKRLKDDLYGDLASPTLFFQAAVAFVLLIACANISSLLLVRASSRKREIAIRSAIGAARSRIVRQLFTESAVLSAAGCVLGLLSGIAGIRSLLAAKPFFSGRFGPAASIALDWRIVAFTIGISLITAVLFGFLPAIRTSGAGLSATLKESGGTAGTGLHHNRTRAILTVGEMMLALLLLIGAGLLIRSFLALRVVKPGFETKNVLTLQMSLSGPRFAKTGAVAALIAEGTARVAAIPGISSVAATSCVPMGCTVDLPVIISGRPLHGASHGDVYWAPVSSRYFEAMRIPLRRGRVFTGHDDRTAVPVAVINEAMARKYWPAGDAFSDRIVIGKGLGARYDDPPRKIIGIVADSRVDSLDEAPKPAVYVPAAQLSDAFNASFSQESPLTWIVRARWNPASLSVPIQEALGRASGGLPVANVHPLAQLVARSISDYDFAAMLLGIFAAAALLLAALGVYGMLAWSVQHQTREIGIRLALGEKPRRVRNRLVLDGMRLAASGGALGIAAAYALSRVLAGELYGVQPGDLRVFVLAPVVLCLVALAAVWFPARRASRIHPMDALRHE